MIDVFLFSFTGNKSLLHWIKQTGTINSGKASNASSAQSSLNKQLRMKEREREGRKVIPIPIQGCSTKGEKTNKHKSRQVDTLAVRERIRKLRDNVKQAKPLGAEAS